MILAIIIFILILGFLIFIHEFGHFILAKKLGVKVEEFGIGFPPRLWKKKKGETIYSINLIPIGGFTKMLGEEGEKHLDNPRSFVSKPAWKKAAIIVGGVMMNFLLAVVIFYFLVGTSGFQAQVPLIFDYDFPFGTQQNFAVILGIAENSPAQEVGLEFQDIVLKGNGADLEGSNQLADFLGENKGKEVVLTVKKPDGQIKEIKVIPRIEHPEDEGAVGIGLGDLAEVRYQRFWEKPTVGFLHSLNLAHYSLAGLGHVVKTSIIEKEIEPLANSVVGPVGILAITKLTLQEGFSQLIFLVAIFSLALAVVNILPFPPLDGGRLFFIIIEVITGKRIPAKIERITQNAGIILLIIMLILVTSKDILQFKDILFKGIF